ncbi:recombinase family protein [Candidatus Woesearchaeota archaeon]|nr:recombinase family protein [Candidatus Woesearchaeota archaeon]MBT7557669.1 recombinase family protein [Candidatus Woesearchaeota archaeon]
MSLISDHLYNPTEVYDSSTTLFGYLRVSSKVQLEEGNSIENQFNIGLKVSKQMGFDFVILNEEFCSTMNTKRPKLEMVKHGIRTGQIKHLWYYSRSRWTRDEIEDGLISRNYFRKYKIKVYEGESGTLRRLDSSQDRMLDRIFTTVQQFDREQRREVSISGKKHMSRVHGETGVFMGGTINFGFKNIKKRWEINETESKYVKKMFQMYDQGFSIKKIKLFLDSEGVRPRRSKTWSLLTLYTMLKNRVYLGEYNWKDKESSEEFKIVLPQIISHSLFNRVQKKIGQNQKNKGNNLRKYSSLLSDVMRCSCGQKISGHIKKTVNKKTYGCVSKFVKWKGVEVNTCLNTRNMNMDDTDTLIVNNIKELVGDSSILKEKFKTDVLRKKTFDSKIIEKEKKKLERGIKIVDGQIDTTVKAISINEVNKLLNKIEDLRHTEISGLLEEELILLQDKKNSHIQEIDDLDSQKKWINWVAKYGKNINDRFDKPTAELINGIVDKIIVRPVMGKTRDNKSIQRGHIFKIYFKLPIVDDGIVWKDVNEKSLGYSLKNGNKVLDGTLLDVSRKGRPFKKKVSSTQLMERTNLLNGN